MLAAANDLVRKDIQDQASHTALVTNHPSSLYYASLLGLTETMEYLQGAGVELNGIGGKYGSALQAAAVNNHSCAVEFLVRHRANVNIPGGKFGSAVAGAASQGHESIVKLLLDLSQYLHGWVVGQMEIGAETVTTSSRATTRLFQQPQGQGDSAVDGESKAGSRTLPALRRL